MGHCVPLSCFRFRLKRNIVLDTFIYKNKIKMKTMLYLILFFFVVALNAQLSSYDKHLELIPSTFNLYWTANTTTNTIHFATQVKTEGWFGFGKSTLVRNNKIRNFGFWRDGRK